MLGYFEQVHDCIYIRYSLYEINIEEVSAGFGMQTENPYYCNTKYGVYVIIQLYNACSNIVFVLQKHY